MAITRVAVSPGSVNGASLAINKPTGTVDDDVLVAFILSIGLAPDTVPSGWTQLEQNSIGTPIFLTSYVKVAASEGAAYTWGATGGPGLAAVICSYRGVDTSSPVSDSSAQANTSSTAVTGAGVTTGAANEMVVWAGAVDAGHVNTLTITKPSALNRDAQATCSTFFASAVCVAEALLAGAGTTDVTYSDGTQFFATPNLVHMVSLTPASTVHVITSTARSKFGGSSATGFGWIKRVGTEISLVGAEFTPEAWVYYVPSAGIQVLFDWGGSGAGTTPMVYVDATGHLCWKSGGSVQFTTTNTLNANAWNHVATPRNSGVISGYVNGVSGGSFSSATTFTTTTQFAFGIDYAATANPWLGNANEVSISVDECFYDSNFTPFNSQFPDSLVDSSVGYILQENGDRIILDI